MGFWSRAVLTLLLIAASVAGALVTLVPAARAQSLQDGVIVVPVRGRLDPAHASLITDALDAAERDRAQLVVIELDSSGAVGVGHGVIGAIRDSPVPVVVHIGRGDVALGGAAHLAAAAHLVAVGSGSEYGGAIPFSLAAGQPGSVDPATKGISDYTRLFRLLRRRPIDARDAAVALGTRRLDSETVRAAGLADLGADTRAELFARLEGRAALTKSGLRMLNLDAGRTPLRVATLGAVRRALHTSASPSAAYLLLLVTIAALLLIRRFGFIPAVIAGVSSPLAVYGIGVLPARWWAVGFVAAGALLVAFDLVAVWLGVPSVIGIVLLLAGGALLSAGRTGLGVGWLVLTLVAGTAAGLSAWAGRRSWLDDSSDDEDPAATVGATIAAAPIPETSDTTVAAN